MAAKELITTSLFNDANLIWYSRLEGNSAPAKGSGTGSDTDITYNSGNGKFGQGAGFNGSSSLISLGTSLNSYLKRSTAFSILAWIKTSGVASAAILSNTDWASPYVGVDFVLLNTGYIKLDISQDGSLTKLIRVTATETLVNDGAFHLATVTYSGAGAASGVNLYVDDNAQTSTVGSDTTDADFTSSTNLQIGSRDGANMVLNGAIDEVALFNRVLSATEVANLYNGTLPPASNGLFFSQL